MPEIVVPTIDQGIVFEDLRKGLAACVKTVAPKARVYSNWPMRYEIGETINMLVSDQDNGKVHAWMMSINRALPSNNKNGGQNIDWNLNVRVWGFMYYDSILTESVIETEYKAITEVIYTNAKHLGMSNTQGLETGGLIQWTDIDVHAFGSGSDVLVAQGNLEVKLKTHLHV